MKQPARAVGATPVRPDTSASACLSDRLGPMAARVEALVSEHVRIWNSMPTERPDIPRTYPGPEKREIERELAGLIDRLSAEQRAPEGEKLEESISRFRPLFKGLLGRLELDAGSVYDTRFAESTRDFIRTAREFDPGLGMASIYQALRNVWVMNTLQLHLGLTVEHTDAVFGYSMIYPYLDNFLDDIEAAEAEKLELVRKLRAWLEGGDEAPRAAHEEKLRGLLERIGRRFPRDQFPEVYRSLLSIHNAQVRSLLQQRATGPPDPRAVLAISLEKGGTSVLADGYLVAGNLRPSEEALCFGFGTFLQLADDLQDIVEDRRRGHATLFSAADRRARLDPVVYRLMRFTAAVLEKIVDPERPRGPALREIVGRACELMAMESVGKQPGCFSRACVRDLEKTFPVRFSYLAKLRKRLGRRFPADGRTISDIDPFAAALMTVSSRAFALD